MIETTDNEDDINALQKRYCTSISDSSSSDSSSNEGSKY